MSAMPRRLRLAMGGLAYHVLNRAAGRGRLFEDDADYQAMLKVIERTHTLRPIRIISLCLMPNHWHMVLWPERDGQLSEFLRLLTVTHTQRWHAHHHSAGTGPVYQGRFKSFPVQEDAHLLTVCRYVERNPVRARMVARAQDWAYGGVALRRSRPPWLLDQKDWPVIPTARWTTWVNRSETARELEAARLSVKRGQPFGDPEWQQRTDKHLNLESTLRPRGRQRIHPIKDSRPL